MLTFFPVLLFPFSPQKLGQRLEAIIWCWLIPVIPIMLTWDGIVSAYRQWTKKTWLAALEAFGSPKEGYATNLIFQRVLFTPERT